MPEKFNLIHYIYSFLYVKIYNRTNIFGIERKNDFDFQFQMWRKEKQQKFIAKEPANYFNRKIEKEKQAPLVDEDKINDKKNKLNKKYYHTVMLTNKNKFNLIYQVIMRNLFILTRFLILQLKILR